VKNMFGGGFEGAALGTAAGVAGIGIGVMGAQAVFNGINNIVPDAKKRLRQ
jgi:hypothetical protein